MRTSIKYRAKDQYKARSSVNTNKLTSISTLLARDQHVLFRQNRRSGSRHAVMSNLMRPLRYMILLISTEHKANIGRQSRSTNGLCISANTHWDQSTLI